MTNKERYKQAFSVLSSNRDYQWIYKIEKKRTLQKRITSIQKIAVAACICLLAIPSTVFAATKIIEYYEIHTTKNRFGSTISVDNKKTVTDEIYVKLSYDLNKMKDYSLRKLKKGEDSIDLYAKHWFSYKQNQNLKKDFYVELYQIQGDIAIEHINAGQTEEMTINNHRAYYAEEKASGSKINQYTNLFPKTLYVFYTEYNYYLKFAAMENVNKENLVKYAEQMELQMVDKSDADEYINTSEVEDKLTYGKMNEEDTTIYEDVIDYGKMATYQDVTYQVINTKKYATLKEARKYTSIQSLTKNDFKSYTREELKLGDGKNTQLEKVVKTENVSPVLIYVTLKLSNHSKDTQIIPANFGTLQCLMKDTAGLYQQLPDNYNRDRKSLVDVSLTQYQPYDYSGISEDEGWWTTKLKPGEEREVKLAYMIDEDFAKNAYMYINDAIELDEKGHSIYGKYLKLLEDN